MKKLLTLILAYAMVCVLFACTAKKNENPGVTTDPGTTTPEVTTPEITTPGTTEYVHKLPEKDYNGREYRVSGHDGYLKREVFVPEESADALDNAVWTRNQIVQDQFDVIIKPRFGATGSSIHAHANEVAGLIMSDVDELDIINTYICSIGPLVTQQLLLDWTQFEYTYLEGSWWTQTINDEFMLDGHLYTPVGSMNMTSLLYTMPVLMNKKLADTYKVYDEVIETIQDDAWTFDYFNSLIERLGYQDVDDENGPTAGDIYAFQGEGLTILDMWQFAFDIPMLAHDDETVLKLAWGQGDYREKLSNAVDMVLELYWENPGSIGHMGSGTHINNFKADKGLFTMVRFLDVFNGVKDMDSTYTVLPWPKYDDSQEKYLCGMGDNFTQMCMPVTVPDSEFVSIITEALHMESEKVMWPVYYEDALRTRYQDDPTSFEMLDLLMEGRWADLGVPFNTNVGLSTMFRNVIRSKSNTILTQIDGSVETYNERVASIVTAYRESANN